MRIEGVDYAESAIQDVTLVVINRKYDADSVKGWIRQIIHAKENQLP